MNKGSRRRVCVVTGTRAEYGILYPVMKAIASSKKLELYIVVTCMHLMESFGYTVNDIEKDGFKIYKKINISYQYDTPEAVAISVGKALAELAKVFAKLSPDFVLILGDRGEVLAAAIAANYLGIPVVHIHGGEVSGHVDGVLRHAITKLSHVHCAATNEAKNRILKLGEEKRRVFITGAPALDKILKGDFTSKGKLLEKYGLDPKERFLLLVQHPVSNSVNEAAKQIKITLEAVKELGLKTIIIYPNADAGGRRMIAVIKRYSRFPFVKLFKSVPHEDYLGLMRFASALIGNSSSGIIEAPSFGLPVINIGVRQKGRQRGLNVIDAPHDKKIIAAAIKKAVYDKKFREEVRKYQNPYGNGRAGKRIARVLSAIPLGNRLIEKRITY